MHINVAVSPETSQGQYLIACARIRNVTVTALVHQLIDAIAQDQLVLAVLDDDGQRHHAAHKHRFREVKL
jgi:hypothetical protein